MIGFQPEGFSERDGRSLLQGLRDLNLSDAGILLASGERVRLEGCLSVDAPVERGVLYGLRRGDGRAEVLGVALRGSRLALTRGARSAGDGSEPESVLEAQLVADRFGRLACPELGARLDLAGDAPRELEHFLRRVVRVALRRLG